MADEKKKTGTLNAPIGELHFSMMEDIIAFERLTKPKYGKTDLVRDWISEAHKKLPEEFKSKK